MADDKENEPEDDEAVMPDNSRGVDSSDSLAKRFRKETNAPASASPCGCNERFRRIVIVGKHSSGISFCALCGRKWDWADDHLDLESACAFGLSSSAHLSSR